MYHVSDVLKHHYCPKLFWHLQHNASRPRQKFIQMNTSLSEVLVRKLEVKNPLIGQRAMPAEACVNALHAGQAVINGRYEYDRLRIKVPLIIPTPEGLDIVFTSMANSAKIEDQHYQAMHLWVLRGLGFDILRVRSLTFDGSILRTEDFNPDDSFVLRDTFTKSNGKPGGNITEVLLKYPLELKETLDAMDELMASPERQMSIRECPLLNRCEYFEACFKTQYELGDRSIFYLTQSSAKRQLIDEGLRTLDEIPLDRLDGSAVQYAQIMADRQGGVFADKFILRHWLSLLKTPVIFMDFEWDTYGIPPYVGMKPLDVLCFQYSLHVLRGEELAHFEFLESGDCRLRFIESLLSNIPSEGSILCYNAFGAEALRLNELGRQFPQYQEALDGVVARMVDLAQLFTDGVVYLSSMRGAYSLKSVIQAIDPSLNYDQLSISHGLEAVSHYRNLANLDDEADVRDALLKYCKMDTLAMVEVLAWLKSLVKEDSHA
jgi:hypothetical protein